MLREEIIQLVREEGRRASSAPGIESTEVIGAVSMAVSTIKKAATTISSPGELFELCKEIDKLPFTPELAALVRTARAQIGEKVLEVLHAKKSASLRPGETDRATELAKERDQVKAVWQLIQVVREKLPTGDFTPTWIETNARAVHRHLVATIRNPRSEVLEWEQVKAWLPEDLQKRFVIDSLMPTEERIVAHIEEYKEIARKLGPEVLAQFLISIQKAGNLKFEQVLRIIAKHLGRCNIDTFNLSDFHELPEAVIKLSGVREVIFLHLRNAIYQRLLNTLPDTATANDYTRVLGAIGEEALEILDPTQVAHLELFKDLMRYFKDVLTIATPQRLVEQVADKEGILRPFPSLRQRIAMKGMADGHRKLVSFFMGSGKTGTAFLSKEHVGAKKMLYICPPHLVDQTRDRVGKYYKEGEAPKVGVISPEMRDGELDGILKNEVVVLPYSMFKSKRDGEAITDRIKAAGFDFVTIDEAHLAKKEGGLNASTIYDFVNEIPGLYESGYVMSLSGEPIPNTPNDIVTQLRIHDRETYGGMTTLAQCLRKVDPLVLRNALLDYMILIDPPEDWEKYVNYEEYDLHAREREVYQAIWQNDELNFSEKLKALSLFLLNPSLFTPEDLESSLLDQCVNKTQEYLSTHDCVMIAENEFKHGVTRTHEDHKDKKTFVEKLQERLGTEVEIDIIDGDTSKLDRQRIIEQSKKKDGKKRVIVAISSTVREGLDLSHINRAIVLEPNFNKPDLAQFVKRFQREGNTDVEVSCLVARDTVQQGVQEHANYKADLGQRFKYGGTLTAEEAEYFAEGHGDLHDDVHILERKLTIGTAIMDKLLTDLHKLHRALAYLHGGGAERCKEFVAYAGKEFADWYSQNWVRSYSGNNGRLVAGLAEVLEKEGAITAANAGKGIVYGDIACGPLVLENTLGAHLDRKRLICSYDINPHQLQAGLKYLRETRGEGASEPSVMGTGEMHKLKVEGLDVLNCSLALHYTKLNVNAHAQNDERVKTLVEFNRVLKMGGTMMLTLPSNVGTPEERMAFVEQLAHFGFEALPQYTGIGQSVDEVDDRIFQNFTIVCKKTGTPKITELDMKKLKLSRMKTTRTSTGTTKAKDAPAPQGSVHTVFKIQDLSISYEDGARAAREAHVSMEEKIARARAMLIEMYAANGNTFDSLPSAEQDRLRAEKIILSRLSLNRDRKDWIFSIEGSGSSEFVFKD